MVMKPYLLLLLLPLIKAQTTPVPSLAPVLCPDELFTAVACVQRIAAQTEEVEVCLDCITNSSAGVLSCASQEEALCPSFQRCCGEECAADLQEYFVCFLRETPNADCPNFMCPEQTLVTSTPTLNPTNGPTPTPISIPPATMPSPTSCNFEQTRWERCMNNELTVNQKNECSSCIPAAIPDSVQGCFSFNSACSDFEICSSACGSCLETASEWFDCQADELARNVCELDCFSQTSQGSAGGGSSGLGIGGIVGIVVGAVGLVLAAVVGVYWKRRKGTSSNTASTGGKQPMNNSDGPSTNEGAHASKPSIAAANKAPAPNVNIETEDDPIPMAVPLVAAAVATAEPVESQGTTSAQLHYKMQGDVDPSEATVRGRGDEDESEPGRGIEESKDEDHSDYEDV